MHPFLRYASDKQDLIIRDIREVVEIESPTGSSGVGRVAEYLIDETRDIGEILRLGEPGTNHVRLDCRLPGEQNKGRLLALGHSDTVWPLGTLETMPFRIADRRLWGPGVLDMKSGLTFFFWAVRMLRDLRVAVARPVSILIVADEETGSRTSRQVTEEEAKASDTVLVLEPGTGLTGKLKTARKGVGKYGLKVRGVAAHAGIDFSNGASAIHEMAHQIQQLAAFTDLSRGISVNPGVITGGTASNVIAAEANAEIDVRMWTSADASEIDAGLRSLTPVNDRCSLEVSGGLNRPPMERTVEIATLFARSKAIGSELGLELEESSTGGGSDGNFTAALGIPTLDGLGAIGEGAHARNESVLIDCIAPRVALLAALIANL